MSLGSELMEEYYDNEIIPPLKNRIEGLIEVLRQSYKEKKILKEVDLHMALQNGIIKLEDYLKIIE